MSTQLSKDDIISRLESIISLMPGHVYWKDVDGYFLGCNDSLLDYFGFQSKNQIIGKTDFDLLDTKQAHHVRKTDKEVIQTKKIISFEGKQIIDNGHTRYFMVKISPLLTSKNQVVGTIGISFEITAEKKALELEKQNELEKKKSSYLKAAAGSIAHDLRTPLASIRSLVNAILLPFQKLIDGYRLAQKHNLVSGAGIRQRKLLGLENALNHCINQVDFSNSYIDLILNNLKYECIQTDNYNSFNLSKTTQEAIDTYPYSDDEQSLVHFNNETVFYVYGNDLYFKNIINNLLKNALYFIKDSRKGEIYIWLENTPSEIILYFKDTAKGAPESIVNKMFDGYFSNREGGTGLGLTFCKSIMESFEGSMIAHSVEGEFMQFELRFPKLESE